MRALSQSMISTYRILDGNGKLVYLRSRIVSYPVAARQLTLAEAQRFAAQIPGARVERE